MEAFHNFLDETGLMELNTKGNKFTWVSNPHGGFVTREKLDKAVVNLPLSNLYPNAVFQALPKGRSARLFTY